MTAKVRGRFIQVLESGAGQIYRLKLRSADRVDLSRINLIDEYGVKSSAQPVFLYEEKDCDGCFETYVSVEMDREASHFSVSYGDYIIAKMSSLKKELMIQQRDIRMCNPGVDGGYAAWLKKNRATSEGADNFAYNPLISIVVPLFNTPSLFLREMLDSVFVQTYKNWQLVLVNASPHNDEMRAILSEVDDDRVKIVALAENLGIAGNTNLGIGSADGDFVGFLDHDDTLESCALEKYVKAINENRDADLLYCDEDNFSYTEEGYYAPLFKPAPNLDLLYSHNYVVHFLMVSRFILDRIELSPDEVSGAQDYDLTLKAWEHARSIKHIPEVLYHWREHAGSTNGGQMESKPYAIAAGAKALANHFERRGLSVRVTPSWIPCVYQNDYQSKVETAATVVVICENPLRASGCVDSLLAHEKGSFSECLVVGDFSDSSIELKEADSACVELLQTKEKEFAKKLGEAVSRANGELILVCRDTVRFTYGGCLANLKGFCSRGDVGVVAPKLFYPDGLTQHAGLCVKKNGAIGFLNQDFMDGMGGGYLGMSECSCNYSAVSPDCFMIEASRLKRLMGEATGFVDPLSFMLDVCVDLRSRGELVVVSPEAKAVNAVPVLQRGGNDVLLGSVAETHLDRKWGASWRQEVLHHPAVDLSASYPRLAIARHPILSAIKLTLLAALRGTICRGVAR